MLIESSKAYAEWKRLVVSEKDLQQSAQVLAIFAYQASVRDRQIPRRPEGVPANPARR